MYTPTPTFISNTLANIAATQPAELPLYTKLFNLYTSAKGYNPSYGSFFTGLPSGRILQVQGKLVF